MSSNKLGIYLLQQILKIETVNTRKENGLISKQSITLTYFTGRKTQFYLTLL